jgi:dipeptidyl-peptidase-4
VIGSVGEPETFPRQNARTRGFTLGVPRDLTVAADGSRVVFLRSKSGDDPVNDLWVFDVAEVRERIVVDVSSLAVEGEEDLTTLERIRRERVGEQAGGIVGYATDAACSLGALVLGGRLFVADLVSGVTRAIDTPGSVFDPRPDPTARRVAYVSGRTLRVVELESREDVAVVGEEDQPDVAWGAAEFIAAEEMRRFHGCWWSPDGERLLAARVDDRPVELWHIANPIDPAAEPRAVRYPAAGTANSDVSLAVFDLAGGRVDVSWDRRAFEYLARVSWSERGPLLLVQSRDQRRTQVLAVDPATGATTVLREDSDPCWVELINAEPAFLADGRLVTTVDAVGTRRLAFDGQPVTPVGLHVRSVPHVGGDHVLVTASEDPMETHVWRVGAAGELARLTEAPGVHDAVAGGDVTVVVSATLEGVTIEIRQAGVPVAKLANLAQHPIIEALPTFFLAGPRELRSALFTPDGAEPDRSLPVLLCPYGGPSDFLQVTRARGDYLTSQWFADQGFAVLVADGRGTPGRGTAWERTIYRDFARPVLEDQVDALHAVAERFGFLDLSHVAIRGWSFGGYLSALAALRRPDVFHAAVAGAPVTDWRLYDTHYTERYLGHPDEEPVAYRHSSLIADAPNLTRPLLLIHGLVDDNVYVANTLRLSRALLEAGRPHTLLPLSGVTHMTPQEVVAENLLLVQLDFLRRALGLELGPIDRTTLRGGAPSPDPQEHQSSESK